MGIYEALAFVGIIGGSIYVFFFHYDFKQKFVAAAGNVTVAPGGHFVANLMEIGGGRRQPKRD